MGDVVLAYIDPIDLDEALVIRVQPLKQTRYCRFPGSAAADNTERISDRNLERDAVERRCQSAGYLKRTLANSTCPLSGVRTPCSAIRLLLRLVDQLGDDAPAPTALHRID